MLSKRTAPLLSMTALALLLMGCSLGTSAVSISDLEIPAPTRIAPEVQVSIARGGMKMRDGSEPLSSTERASMLELIRACHIDRQNLRDLREVLSSQ